ncbi:MAG: amino acid adenylation domain-containing protein [Bacteroidota bacterium]
MGSNKHTDPNVPDRFAACVAQTPRATALVFRDRQLTYLELSERANQLAHHLQAQGIGPDSLVAICVERSVEMIVGILGILKAGGAYLPLDPHYPLERLRFLLDDAQPLLLLTQAHLLPQLPTDKNLPTLCLDRDWPMIARAPQYDPEHQLRSDNLAYAIYTSGSTGRPKGVLVEHRNLLNLIRGQAHFVQHRLERYLFAYSFAFDGAVLLIWSCLLEGATLVLAEENLEKDLTQLADFIRAQGITHLLTFPSLYALLLDRAASQALPSLVSVSVAGEVCPAALVRRHHELLPGTHLFNQYGPTEATVGASIFRTSPDFGEERVPIGRAIEGVQLYVLDEQLRVLPDGVTGELYIGGRGVARGYHRRPALTAERFVPDPFTPGQRLYRTGDLGRRRSDGHYDFLGRVDHQIKLRGYRIELGEIEALLLRLEGVREAAVVVWGEKAEEQQLVAFVALQQGTPEATDDLRAALTAHLPEYMLPSRIFFREQLPLAPSGKVDRQSLATPRTERPALAQSYAAPRHPLEAYLCTTWAALLRIETVGIHDKFFELGGNSLLAARLINDLQTELGETIFIVALFNHPSVAEFAAFLERTYPRGLARLLGAETKATDSQAAAALNSADFTHFRQYVPRIAPPSATRRTKNPPAVFILAPPRSGTTLLRVMLAGHPRLFAANELQLLGFHDLDERRRAYSDKFALWGEGLIRVWMEIFRCTVDEAKVELDRLAQLGESTAAIYQRLQSAIGDQLLVDKSPAYALDPVVLAKAEAEFDGAIYLHLVRHPYAMVRSFEKMHLDQVMYLRDHPYRARQLGELIWTESHRNIRDFLQSVPAERQFQIHYEDLVRDPEIQMRALCNHLAWDYHPQLIQPYKGIETKLTDGIYRDSKPMGDVRLLEHGRILPQLAEQWRGVLNDDFLHDTTWQLATDLGCELPPQRRAVSSPSPKEAPTSGLDIAIVGMSARYPGAKNIGEFWQNLRTGKDVSREVREEDLRAAGLDPALLNDPDFVRRALFLDDADCFDADFFGYLPAEAALMDPQHRVYLECAYAALEDAGYDPSRFPGLIGIYGGIARNTYLVNNVMSHPQYFRSLDDFMLGIALEKDFPATRVAYQLHLRGPAINVQTACSSSGAALHLACQTLRNGDADMMLVGGGRIQPPLGVGHQHREGHALSPDGYCRTFSDRARGMVRGQGMGFLVLKPLERARADGDTIHAVIKGTGISNDGSDKIGFTAPSVRGQAEAIYRAYQSAGISPETVDYIEAHGTGTPLGDPIEVAALSQAFRRFTDRKNYCGIGSVKTNIGHLDAGACIAGIIKVALSMHHEKLPASLHFERPNPQIDFANSPFRVQQNPADWPRGAKPRRAGVSSLGLGGTNIHVVLEEAPRVENTAKPLRSELLLLAAKTESALDQLTEDLADHWEQHPALDPAAAAYTLQLGRRHWPERRFVLAEPGSATAATLRAEVGRGTSPAPTEQRVAFMFPGGGAQHCNMGRGLYDRYPVFREAVDTCLAWLARERDLDLRAILYPEDAERSTPIEDPLHGITLLFTVEYATAQLWLSWGLRPAALIGHSLGEYTAACIAGVLRLPDALAMVAERGKLFATLPRGGMLSIPLPVERVRGLLNGHHQLSFAAINKPNHCVVSGAVAAIDRAKQLLNQAEIHSTRLHISVAAHSHEVEPILRDFERFLKGIAFGEAQLPLISNVTGQWARPGELQSPRYWANHLRQTVRFSDGIGHLLEIDQQVLLEVGPGQTLATFARQHPQKRKGQVILASLRHPKEKIADSTFILKSVGQLWTQGLNFDWAQLHGATPPGRIPLPTYPFARTRHWIEAKAPLPTDVPQATNVLGTMKNEYPQTLGEESAAPLHRTELLVEKIKAVFHQLSGIPVEEMDPRSTFLEMGFDSLFLTQAVARLKKEFKVPLSFRQLFDEAPQIDSLAALLDAQLPAEAYREELDQRNAPLTPPPTPTAEPPAPLSNPPLPAQPTGAPPSSGTANLEAIVQRQLQIMEQQLALLRGQPLPAPPPPTPAVSQSPGTPPTRTLSAGSPSEPAPKSPGPVKKALQSFGPWKPPKPKAVGQLSEREQKYLTELIERYTHKTQGSQALAASQRLHMADPRSITGFNKLWKDMIYQIAVERSKGAYFWDVDGHRYVDFLMSFGVSLLGHTPDFVQTAVRAQLDKGIELGVLTPLAKEVCELLCQLTGMARATLVNTGSEAVSAAVRAARTVTGKDKIAVFEGDYHGIADELLVRSLNRDGEAVAMPVAPGIPSSLVQQVIVLDYDDPDVLEVIHRHADELAAVLIEPVQPKAPHRQPRELLHAIRRVTAERDIALIFDEMITGFRLGIGGAQEWYGIEVDLVAYGKIISGGLPMAAVVGRARFLDPFDGGMWQFGDDSVPPAGVTFFGGTFVKNPLALAASRATLQEIQRRGPAMYEALNARSAHYAERLRELFLRTKAPLRVLAAGSIVAIQTTDSNPLSKLFFYYLVHKGVHQLDKAGLISTAHTVEDLDFAYRMVEETIREMQTAGFFQMTLAEVEDRNAIVYPPHQLPKETPPPTEKKKLALTEGQKEVWVEHRLGREAAAAYNLAGELQLKGTFDFEIFCWAAQQLIDRHDSLRSHFDRDDLTQTIQSEWAIEPEWIDLNGLPEAVAAERLEHFRRGEVEEAFALFTGPLFRLKVLRMAPDDHRILLTAHHGIADGWSCGILAQELGALYRARWQGRAPQLPPAKSITDFVEEQLTYLRSEAFRAAEAHWLGQFADGIPVLELPTDRSRPPLKTYAAAQEQLHLDPALLAELKALAAQRGTTLFFLLYTAFQTLLHRLSGQEDFVLGLTAAAQAIAGNQNLVAHGVSLLPVRLRTDRNARFVDTLGETRRVLLDALEHQNYSLGTLVKKLAVKRDPGRQPLISVLFNMDADGGEIDFGTGRARVESIPRHYETFDSFINLKPTADGAVMDWIYNTDLFDAVTIQRRLAEFHQLLRSILQDPERPLWALPLLPEAEKALLRRWNATETDFPQQRLIHEFFEAEAARRPERVALICAGQRLDYATLNREANQLAHLLVSEGLRVGDFVGVYFERSAELLISLLAVLKAGGVYVPLDPINPVERIQLLLEDAEAKMLLTHRALEQRLPDYPAPVFVREDLLARLQHQATRNVAKRLGAEDLAYVIYTSGSTGRPKSVAIPHYAVVDHHWALQKSIGMGEDDTILSVASVAFDPSVQDFFLPLFLGAKVAIATKEETRDGFLLGELIDRVDATIMQATPATWRSLLMAGWKGKVDLTILSGGEGLTVDFARKLLDRGRTVYNIYGPTETTIWSTYKKVERSVLEASSESGYVAVGQPLSNVQLYLLDEHQQRVPIGVAGEVYIGGVGVAPGGYFKRPELTAERFVPHPFSRRMGERLYRTGDLGRLLNNGDLEYLSRVDSQVKIRGYRIELGEIESYLSQFAGVLENVVMVREDRPDDKRLVAYLVLESSVEWEEEALRRFLQKRLPGYMIPTAFVLMEAFPLTTTLKINRKRLPPPDWDKRAAEAAFLAPQDDTERMLAQIWSELLGVARIGRRDNFFELGGHSLIAVNMMAKVEAASGKKLPLSCLLENSTIEGLSRLLRADEAPSFQSLVPIRAEGTKLPIYLVHGAGLHVLMFQTLAQHMDPEQPIYALQARGLHGEAEPLDSLEAIAAHYNSEILRQNPRGPYALAGYSFGGLIAFEMAKQLRQMGREVAMLGMFDTVVRQSIRGERESYYRQLKNLGKKVAWNLSLVAKSPLESLRYKTNTLQVRLRRWASGLRYDDREEIRGDKSAYAVSVDQKNQRAFGRYKITPYDGEIYLFRAEKRQFWVDDFEYLGWQPYARGGIRLHEVPGDHLYLFNPPHGPKFARILQRVLDEVGDDKEEGKDRSAKR